MRLLFDKWEGDLCSILAFLVTLNPFNKVANNLYLKPL